MGRRGVHVPQTVPGDPHGFPALVAEFCTDLATRGYSPATIRNRRQALATLAGWLADRGVTRPVQVTRPMLVRYQRHLFHYRKANGQPLSSGRRPPGCCPSARSSSGPSGATTWRPTPPRTSSCRRSSTACPNPR